MVHRGVSGRDVLHTRSLSVSLRSAWHSRSRSLILRAQPQLAGSVSSTAPCVVKKIVAYLHDLHDRTTTCTFFTRFLGIHSRVFAKTPFHLLGHDFITSASAHAKKPFHLFSTRFHYISEGARKTTFPPFFDTICMSECSQKKPFHLFLT